MKLELLNIEDFIIRNKLKQVTTVRLYEKAQKTDPGGLFSEEIFGRFGTVERRKTFAYVDLKTKLIHPEAYPIIAGLDVTISKLLTNKQKYSLKDKLLVEDSKGSSGVDFLVSIFDKLDLDKLSSRPKNVNFIKSNKNKIFIDKYLILPAGIRDLTLSKTSGRTMVNFSDLSELYTLLIRQTNAIGNVKELPQDIKAPMIDQIQRSILTINDWIKSRLKGKSGLIRGGLLRKVTDYSGRLVVTTDHTLPLGTVGLPWAVVLKLYEPFAINYILKKDANAIGLLQQSLNTDRVDITILKTLFAKLITNPDIISAELKEYLFHVAQEIVKDKVVIYKRDPVENRDSWLAGDVKVTREGTAMSLNPLDLVRTGGDHDGDQFAVLSLFTKEAQLEAKTKMHPKYTESMWTRVTSANETPYQITLDAATALYAATKQ